MSEQQSQPTAVQATTTGACPHPEAVGERWGDSVSEWRQADLQRSIDLWEAEKDHGERKGPFDAGPERSEFLTGAEVGWLARRVRDMDDIVRGLHLEGANLSGTHLEGADLYGAHLEGADLTDAHLEHAILVETHLEGAHLGDAHLEGASLHHAHLEHAILAGAHLEGADLTDAHLEDTNLGGAHLESASLLRAHLEGASLDFAHLEGADLRRAFLDRATTLQDIALGNAARGYASLADVRWGEANLAVVQWSQMRRRFLSRRLQAVSLGDEQEAWKSETNSGIKKDKDTRRRQFEAAVRANRQVATVLRSQGLNADADRFSYKAQVLERQVHRRQHRRASALGSWFLDLISGYGYRPMRSLITYVLVILTFAAAYFSLGGANGQSLSWNEAIVISMTAFHGRGVFSAVFQPGDLQAAVAAVEAFIGLLIEITLIATFTQRFFAR